MAKLKNLTTILKDGHELPIGQHVYNVPLVNARTGARFAAFSSLAIAAVQAEQDGRPMPELNSEKDEVLSDEEEEDLYRSALTEEVYAQMEADGQPFEFIRFAATYVLIHSVFGEDKAAEYWSTGGKAAPRNRAGRRTGTRTRTGAAGTTRKRG